MIHNPLCSEKFICYLVNLKGIENYDTKLITLCSFKDFKLLDEILSLISWGCPIKKFPRPKLANDKNRQFLSIQADF